MGDAARVSHEPFLERGVVGDPSQSQVKIAKTPKQGGSRTSLMFSCEDFYVDSTSVLKDSRHPSHTHLNTPTGGSVTHRVVSITMFFKTADVKIWTMIIHIPGEPEPHPQLRDNE